MVTIRLLKKFSDKPVHLKLVNKCGTEICDNLPKYYIAGVSRKVGYVYLVNCSTGKPSTIPLHTIDSIWIAYKPVRVTVKEARKTLNNYRKTAIII